MCCHPTNEFPPMCCHPTNEPSLLDSQEKSQRDARARWSAVAEVKARRRQEAAEALRQEEEFEKAEREEREWRLAVERQVCALPSH